MEIVTARDCLDTEKGEEYDSTYGSVIFANMNNQ